MRLLKSSSILGLFLLLALVGCSGDSDTGTAGETVQDDRAPSVSGTPGGKDEATSPDAGPSPATGGLDLRVTDAPPEGVTRIDITVGSVEVHRADAEEEEGWIDVFPISTSTPQTLTFDLVEVTGIEGVLTQLEEFEVGKYTQIRMDVVTVSVTLNGEVKEARVPSDKLKVVRPFDVEAGQTTVLTLDFDADKSVVITGAGNVQFKPTVKLLVRKEDRSKKETEGQSGQGQGVQASAKKDDGQSDRGKETATQGQSGRGEVSTPQASVGESESSESAITLVVAEHAELGAILVDGEGATVYVFTNDEPNVSSCTGGCARSWPPLATSGETGPQVREGVNADLIGTIERSDGVEQVTYNSRPLYHFSGDRRAGDARGHGLGSVWFAVSPDGEPVN